MCRTSCMCMWKKSILRHKWNFIHRIEPLPPKYKTRHALFLLLEMSFRTFMLVNNKKTEIVVFDLKILETFFDALYFGAQPPTLYWFVDDKIDKTWNDDEILLYRLSHLLRYALNNDTDYPHRIWGPTDLRTVVQSIEILNIHYVYTLLFPLLQLNCWTVGLHCAWINNNIVMSIIGMREPNHMLNSLCFSVVKWGKKIELILKNVWIVDACIRINPFI